MEKSLSMVDALRTHFKDAMDTLVLFDVFSVNQHSTDKKDFGWWSGTFREAIKSFGSPWHDPIPLTRVWCLWELYCTHETGCVFEVAMSDTERSKLIADLEYNCEVKLNRMKGTIDEI